MKWLDDLVRDANARIPDRVRESLYGRGVTDEQIQLFQIGHLTGPVEGGVPGDFARWVQRAGDSYVLPLTNVLGEIKGIQLRRVDREQRGYDTWQIDDGEPALFGLGQAMPHVWRTGTIFLVEGAFDLFPVQRAVPYTVSTLTAWVGSSVVRLLRKLVRRVWLGYDMDPTGRRACSNFQNQHPEFETLLVVYPRATLADGTPAKDPSDYWEAWGDSRLTKYLRSTMETLDG